MMGQLDSAQDKLFCSFNLDNHVPHTHLLRGIDRALDLGDLRQHLAPFYSPIGRPSIDPEFMIRMLMRGLLLRHSLRAQAMRRGPSEPGISVVLSPGSGACRT
jgi:transposase